MYLTKKHISPSRRCSAAWARPSRCRSWTRWCRRARCWRRPPRPGKTRLACIEMVHGAAGSTQIGLAKNLWSPAAVGRSFDLSPSSLSAARAVPRLPDDRQQHRLQERRGVRVEGDRRRSLPLERGVPDADAPEADRRLGRAGRRLARSALRAAVRAGHADSVDAAVHRERRPVRRLRLRLRLRLHRHDQLGGAKTSRCR